MAKHIRTIINRPNLSTLFASPSKTPASQLPSGSLVSVTTKNIDVKQLDGLVEGTQTFIALRPEKQLNCSWQPQFSQNTDTAYQPTHESLQADYDAAKIIEENLYAKNTDFNMRMQDILLTKMLINHCKNNAPEYALEYKNLNELNSVIDNLKLFSPQSARVVVDGQWHRALLDLRHHKDGRITAIVIDGLARGIAREIKQKLEPQVDACQILPIDVEADMDSCTMFTLNFAFSSYQHQAYFDKLHQKLLNGEQINATDLPLDIYKHIQQSNVIEKLQKNGMQNIDQLKKHYQPFRIAYKNAKGNSQNYVTSIAWQRYYLARINRWLMAEKMAEALLANAQE